MGDALPYVDLGTGALVTLLGRGRFSFSVVLSDGSLKLWGWNRTPYAGALVGGQLGQGDANDRGDEPNDMGDALLAVRLW